jgi:hypothetical protein
LYGNEILLFRLFFFTHGHLPLTNNLGLGATLADSAAICVLNNWTNALLTQALPEFTSLIDNDLLACFCFIDKRFRKWNDDLLRNMRFHSVFAITRRVRNGDRLTWL